MEDLAEQASLTQILDLAELGDNTFRARARSGLRAHVFGGQLLGQSVVAAGRTVAAGQLPHSLHAYFERSGGWAQPITYHVEVTRDGRSSARRRVVAVQGSVRLATVELSFHLGGGVSGTPARPQVDANEASWSPDAVGEELAVQLRSWLAGLTQMMRLEVRFFEEPVRSRTLRTGWAPPGQRFLVRSADALPDDPLIQAAAVAYLSDLFLLAGSLGPRGIVMGDSRLRAVSLDHALWFSPAAHARTWLLHETSTVRSSADRALCRGAIYDLTGTPVADTTQEGLVRITDDTQ
ncbi:acyl-CoA thioesterase II [Williamsia sp. DF01-3]|uniref:acyl-CoA thioesterase n=1 Tax=Williamsia sp. DF01-3 TaxID=2934157 RepID=UPI001FF3E91A|nr:acyl-CoA thioesterase domain-containing protein [Williamsia sp. DF01-3]MCK0516676.1 thioesterase family protein [Williamsia sp. DF01-3]